MNSPDLTQIRIDPRDDPSVIGMVERFSQSNGLDHQKVSPLTWLRLHIDAWIHPLGIHHYVPYHTFDAASRRMITHPGKWACLRCPRCVVR